MKSNNNSTAPRGWAGRLFLKVIPILMLIWMILYTLTMVVSVVQRTSSFRKMTGTGIDTLSWSREEWQLLRDKTFLEARVAMAVNDSIGLTIDFGDSLVRLENKGVTLREVRFSKAETSRLFRSFTPQSYARTFATPFSITEIEGSIAREPIQVKKAPRDSVEAAQNVTVIDTSKVEFVEWHLQLDSFMVVSFIQSEPKPGLIDWPALQYRFRRHAKTLTESFRNLIHLRLPEYKPELTIAIPASEAKSFFRALPPNGQVALKF